MRSPSLVGSVFAILVVFLACGDDEPDPPNQEASSAAGSEESETGSSSSDAQTSSSDASSLSGGGNNYEPCDDDDPTEATCTRSPSESFYCDNCFGTNDCLLLSRVETGDEAGRCAPPCTTSAECPGFLSPEGMCSNALDCLPLLVGGAEEHGRCGVPCMDDAGCPAGTICVESGMFATGVCLQRLCTPDDVGMSN
jgi:hypothetical protein